MHGGRWLYVLAASCYGSYGPRRRRRRHRPGRHLCCSWEPLLPVARPLPSVAPTLTPSQVQTEGLGSTQSWGEGRCSWKGRGSCTTRAARQTHPAGVVNV
jgi:hypothetical protein